MPINIYWDNDDKTIIRVDIIQPWELDEFYRLHEVTTGMLNTVDHKVAFIADVRELGGLPRGISLRQTSKVLSAAHPNDLGMILIGMNRGIQMFMNVILRVFPVVTNVILVQTEDEAYQKAYDLLNNLPKGSS